MFKLKLKSDFTETYDAFFDKEGLEFRRMSNEGPTRLQMFNEFRQLGIQAPKFGGYILFMEDNPDNLVVLHHGNKHNGEGKQLKALKDVNDWERGNCLFCEYYFPTLTMDPKLQGHSSRILCIGNRAWSLEYYSYEDWRSNCGEGDILLKGEIPLPAWRSKLAYPLLAIDFVGPDTNLKAIDLNIAPGIRGIKLGLQGYEIVNLIKEYYKCLINS